MDPSFVPFRLRAYPFVHFEIRDFSRRRGLPLINSDRKPPNMGIGRSCKLSSTKRSGQLINQSGSGEVKALLQTAACSRPLLLFAKQSWNRVLVSASLHQCKLPTCGWNVRAVPTLAFRPIDQTPSVSLHCKSFAINYNSRFIARCKIVVLLQRPPRLSPSPPPTPSIIATDRRETVKANLRAIIRLWLSYHPCDCCEISRVSFADFVRVDRSHEDHQSSPSRRGYFAIT